MAKKKDESIQELIVPAMAKDCQQFQTPIGMSIAMEPYEDKCMYFGVIKKANSLSLVYACYTAEGQEGLADLVAAILYKHYKGTLPEGKQLTPADLTSAQVAALAGYHSGVTVVLDLDGEMAEVYSYDPIGGYVPPVDFESIFYNQEFYACACAADIPALFKVNEFSFESLSEF